MISTEEKENFVSWILGISTANVDSVAVQKRLHELLMKDTNGGKLYKYRSFDKDGYSLENLKNGTLHCSVATSFNDPFDCKIGLNFHSLYKDKYETEFELAGVILERFFGVVNGNISIRECSEDEQRILNRLMKRDRLMRFAQEGLSGISSEEEIVSFLMRNSEIIAEFMSVILDDPIVSQYLNICASKMPKILENITEEGMMLFSREDASVSDIARANGIIEDADEIELIMYLNGKLDPESTATVGIQKFIDEWDEKMSKGALQWFQIGCLCTNPKNRLMWSHYADSHKGFCIEYDFSDPSKEVLEVLPLPVIYSDKRPLISWKAAFEQTPENMEIAYRQLLLGLLTKDSEWSYENEWRIFIDMKDPADLVMPRISCIYLGASISDENRNRILEIAKEKKIPVKQMKVDRGEYQLRAKDVF